MDCFQKGEETLYLYEILDQEPYFQVLSPYKAEGLHFALAFLPKVFCDIKAAEIGRAYRLTKDNRVERMSFSVPRVKVKRVIRSPNTSGCITSLCSFSWAIFKTTSTRTRSTVKSPIWPLANGSTAPRSSSTTLVCSRPTWNDVS